MQNSDIELVINQIRPVTLDAISSVRLMNRIEIKYVFGTRKLVNLLKLLGNYYKILEISNMRMLPYSTTYLDTADYLFYYQHVRGEFDRHKIRYRKYEATEESFLEIKRKTNKGRTIKRRIKSKTVSGYFDNEADRFIEQYLPVSSEFVRPALNNHFTRITLAGIEMKERLTIDFNISFSDPENIKTMSLPFLAIAELKKEAYSDSSYFRALVKQLNIYPTGFSKYCVGSGLLNDSLKKNMLKPKLLLIDKLENENSQSDIIR